MQIANYINGVWSGSDAGRHLDVINPATTDVLGQVPLSSRDDVDKAVRAAQAAFIEWRRTPVTDRVQCLFKFKTLLEENLEELARTITQECGKTLAEARGEVKRGIENVETACGMPSLI